MKTKSVGLIAMACLLLSLATYSFGGIVPFAHAQGYGLQTQTSSGEEYDINSMFGMAYPVTSWSSANGWGWTFRYTLTVDTDYIAGLHPVGYDTNYTSIEVYLY